MRPSSLAAGVTGSYTLTAAVADEDVTGCDAPWIVGSMATSQTLATADCTEDGSLYWDDYLFGLSPGGSVEVAMTSAAFTPRIVLWEGTGTGVSLVADEVGAGSQVSVSHTAPAESGRTYLLELLSEEDGATGAYSVTLEIAGPAVTAVAPAAGTEPFVGERHGSDGGFGWPAPRSNAPGSEWRSVTPPRPASPPSVRYHSAKIRIPASKSVFGRKPRSSRAFVTSAYVHATSPGWRGRARTFGFRPNTSPTTRIISSSVIVRDSPRFTIS